MTDITVEFVYSEDVAVQGYKEIMKSENKLYFVTPILGTLSAAIILFVWISQREIEAESIFVLLLSLVFAFKIQLSSLQVKKNYRKSPGANTLAKYTFNEEGIQMALEGSGGFYNWDKIYKAVRNKKGLLIFPQPRLAHWIPAEYYDDEKIPALESLFVNNNVKYKKKI